MRLKSIEIRGMNKITQNKYEFEGNMCYLYGRNGAGKTTVLQAIQLALLGYIPGEGKKNQSIFRHSNGKSLEVVAILQDENQTIKISREWTMVGSSVASVFNVEPEGYDIHSILNELELPVFNFNDFIRMTSNSLKDWFISFLPSQSSSIEWSKSLTEALGDIKVIDTTLVNTTLSEINELYESMTEGQSKECLSFEKKQLKKNQGTIQSLIHYDEELEFSEEEIQSKIRNLETLQEELLQWENESNNHLRVIKALESIKTNAESLEQDIELQEHINKSKEDAESFKECEEKYNRVMSELQQIQTKIARIDVKSLGYGVCPYLNITCDSVVSKIEELKEQIRPLKEQEESLRLQLDNLKEERESLESSLKYHQSHIDDIRMKYQQKAELEKYLKPVDVRPTSRTHEDIKQEIDNLTDMLIKLHANARYDAVINIITADKYKIENTIEVYKKWIDLTGVNGLQSDISNKPFELLSHQLTDYLVEMFDDDSIFAEFDLRSKSNSFSFGLRRDDRYIEFDLLSSGEKCLYTIALMRCLLESSSCDLKLILIDDLLDHLDDDNARILFESLSNIDNMQFIFAGVKPCTIDTASEILLEVK